MFINDLIVEEFNGEKPSRTVLAALSHYVRSLASPENEGIGISRSPINITMHFDRLDEAFHSAETALRNGDDQLAVLLIAGTRHQVGLIHQRFQGKRLKEERKLLENLGRNLGFLRNAISTRDPKLSILREQWSDDFSRARDVLTETADQSLYNLENLESALATIQN